jgi:gliding motility-associated-like protein
MRKKNDLLFTYASDKFPPSFYRLKNGSRTTRWLILLFVAAASLLFAKKSQAQFTATWGLTSTTNKTSVTGGIDAGSVSAGLMAPGTSFPIPGSHNTDGYRCQIASGNWPTVATDGFNIDFPLSANGSYNLNLSGLTFTAKCSGGSGNSMASLAYQADGAGAWTSFGTPQILPSGGTTNIVAALATALPAGHTYVIRMYVYAAGTTTSSRSVYIKNVVFSGTVAAAGPAPTVLTTAAAATGTSTGTASGDITSGGAWPVTASGFCWDAAADPTIALPTITTNGPVSGAFTSPITGLSAGTTYHVRAYATSIVGTSYGADLTFTTSAATVATLTTTTAVANSPVTAASGGNITDNGGVPVTQRGVCWNTTGTPTYPGISNTNDGTGTGSFSSFLINLSPSTTYFVRAYAVNSVGTAYGNEVSFTTPPPSPTILVLPDSLGFGTVLQGTTSPNQTFTLQGFFLTPASGNINITAPPGYQISTNPVSGFANSLNIAYTGGNFANFTVYVHFSPTALANYNKIITITAGNAPAKTVKVTGAIDPVGGQGQTGFSNRGTDFWTGFGPHEKITSADGSNSNAIMTLYFSSDSAAVVTIYVGNSLVETINLPANTITASSVLPWTGADDARLINEGVIAGKGIYIHSTKPMVAYAEISGSSVTAATVLFPQNTLGKNYTALNYTQLSNSSSANSRSYCFAVATQDNTTVEVTLPAGITSETGLTGVNTRTLNKGDVWLIKGSDNVTDITGTQIKSISTAGSACQPIAVFSGSGKIAITCDGTTASSDNLFQQSFPSVAWGRKYVSAPTGGASYSDNIYRVMINPDYASTVVTVNGVTLPNAAPIPGLVTASTVTPGTAITLVNNLYYEFRTSIPVVITSTSPVMVAQYITNRTKCGNNYAPSAGDPDMIYLSPVEQTIDKIIVSPIATSSSTTINFINVVIKTADIPNFTITDQNATAVPAVFTAIDGTFSYAQIPLTAGYSPSVFYKLSSTGGGFNAISYGYSSSESYAYNAGTNLVDLLSGFSVQNQFGSGVAVAACKGSQFYMSVTLAFKPVSILWDFGSNPDLVPNANVTQTGAALLDPQVLVDSVIINGVQLYTYRIPAPYVYNAVNTFNVHVSATSPTPDGCNGVKEYIFPVTVVQGPVADFTFSSTSGCLLPVQFTDASLGNAGTVNTWQWNFGDSPAGTSAAQNPSYTYTSGGTFTVHLRAITAEGCYGDTAKVITFSGVPVASFTANADGCVNVAHTFTNGSTITSGTITQWNWNFGAGAGSVVNATNGNAQTYTYTAPGVYTATLTAVSSTGCSSTVFSKQITIAATPAVTFAALSGVCNTTPSAAITGGSPATVSGVGTGVYSGPGVSNGNFDPAVAGVGTHTITYTYTTQAGCTAAATQTIVVAQSATLSITAVAPVCVNGDPVALVPSVAGGVFTGTGVTGNTFTPSTAGVGTFTIGYSIPSNTCTVPASLQITVNPAPADFSAGTDVDGIFGRTATLTGTGPSTNTYLWSPAAALTNPASLVTVSAATVTTTYTLTATNSFGCKAAEDVLLTITKLCVDPPNVFTPNNDGFYDKWVVINGSCTKQVEVNVYNRWGGLVYSNDRYNNEWDGTHKGKALPDGTYYYLVKAFLSNGEVLSFKGNVTIMR